MNKIIALGLATMMTSLSTAALADYDWRRDDDGHYDRARVLSVEPITTTVRIAVPQTECYQQQVRRPVYSRGGDGAALVGGIVGSVIGHNIDNGRGAATVAGAIIGAAVGRTMAQDTDDYYETIGYENRCDVYPRYQIQQHLEGYAVTYRYQGQVYTTRMHDYPGRFIRVRVDVSPVVE
jgi:uncharacterized protein YcfJ